MCTYIYNPSNISPFSHFGDKTIRQDYPHPDLQFDPLTSSQFAKNIDHMHSLYDWEVNQAQLNLLDSHDMPRALWMVGEDKSALKLSALFQMTMPGSPCIYYGDEIGLSSPGDPHCRGAFPWDKEETWDKDLLGFYQQAVALRQRYPVLRTGTYQLLKAEGDVFSFLRQLDDVSVVVVFNTSQEIISINWELDKIADGNYKQVWPPNASVSFKVDNGKFSGDLPPP